MEESISSEFAIYFIVSFLIIQLGNAGRALTCGTHFGDTNDPASIVRRPVFASLSMRLFLVSSEIVFFSFCNPSRGPTSTIWTLSLATVVANLRSPPRPDWNLEKRASRTAERESDDDMFRRDLRGKQAIRSCVE